MLKGFVSGEEKDIVRIPMKGKNLLDYNVLFGDNPDRTSTYFIYYKIVLEPNTQYTMTTNVPNYFMNQCPYMFGTQNIMAAANDSVYSNEPKTITSNSDGSVFIACRVIPNTNPERYVAKQDFDNGTYYIMLNTGNQALPYEPYGYQEGWEVRDNEDRILWGREDELQTATGTLPFKGYSLPVKVKSLLGNAVQNGTPAPDNIITPEMCGVRTVNICPSAAAETKTNNGITAVSNGSGTYHVSGTATADADIRFGIQSFLIPKSIGSGGSGTYCIFNSATYENAAVKIVFYYQGTKIDDWGMTVRNRTNTSYTIMSEKDCDAIGFTVKSGVTVDFTISPEFTDDGVLPTEYEPYGWKVPFENHGENLFDYSTLANDYTLNATTGLLYTFPKRIATLTPIDISALTSVTLSYQSEIENTMFIYAVFNGNTLVSRVASNHSGDTIDVSGGDDLYVSFYSQPDDITIDKVSDIMLTPGSTPKPYSPYLNETIPIYLGEVPTVRRIAKEEILSDSIVGYEDRTDFVVVKTRIVDLKTAGNKLNYFCSHFKVKGTDVSFTVGVLHNNYNNFYNMEFGLPTTITSLNEAKAWFDSEYAAGHPVTIWYVLATEQITISNEPLCKISTYADELTTIQVHGLSAPLYGIGDYKDTLNLSTGVVTRKVKKLVLDGTEDWGLASVDSNRTVCRLSLRLSLSGIYVVGYCTHINWKSTYESQEYNRIVFNDYLDGSLYVSLENSLLSGQTAYDFKSYLAAQYQAGTPVTIWYVLAEPETETVTVPTGMTGEIEGYLTQVSTPTPTNRSVPKWNGVEETGGTYAVTVYTPPEIPTTIGQNTLTVETEKIHGLTNPLCGIGDYKDILNLSTGVITRKVKKWVLTGSETIGNYNGIIYVQLPDDALLDYAVSFSTHYIGTNLPSADAPDYSLRQGPSGYWGGRKPALVIKDSNHNSSELFQNFIAAQYQAGHPVTVWYVLSTPETETITVPYGLECSVEGYLTQSSTPTPSSPITPDSNGILESGGTYAVEVSLAPSSLTVKGHIKELT